MVITYYGKQYFKLTLGDLTIATNPPSKASKPTRFGADIALITTNTPDYNDPETVTMGDREPFVIDSAGSYEVRELFFTGAGSTVTLKNPTSPKGSDGAREYINTVYGFELDNIKICFLGCGNDEKSFSNEAKEIASSADVLFISVGTDASLAYKTATLFDPNVIIPMDYTDETLKRFLKEAGQDLPAGREGKNKPEDKLTIKRRDLDGKQGHIIVLAAQ